MFKKDIASYIPIEFEGFFPFYSKARTSYSTHKIKLNMETKSYLIFVWTVSESKILIDKGLIGPETTPVVC